MTKQTNQIAAREAGPVLCGEWARNIVLIPVWGEPIAAHLTCCRAGSQSDFVQYRDSNGNPHRFSAQQYRELLRNGGIRVTA